MEAYKIFKQLAEPIGATPALFTVDYRDDDDNYFHQELTTIIPPAATPNDVYRQITLEAFETIEGQGYTVYSIDHIMDGLSYDELHNLSMRDQAEARKHITTVYRDFRREREMDRYPSVSLTQPFRRGCIYPMSLS